MIFGIFEFKQIDNKNKVVICKKIKESKFL